MTSTLSSLIADRKVVCLAGGVGGAKLADGLAQILSPEQLTIIVNTGDDFEHMGLKVCPDLDTVLYTLAGVANPETGWGRSGESWRTMAAVRALGGPDWFSLGDLDLATHLTRTDGLNQGESLTTVTAHLCAHFEVPLPLLPMSNQAAPTEIVTDDGTLPFQVWFVKERWQPRVRKVQLPENVRASGPVTRALELADYVIFAPSNPFVSIDPILNVYPIREMIMDLPRATVAVTPIVGGRALKGPAAKMMAEMGLPVTVAAVAAYYGELLDGFVYDEADAVLQQELTVERLRANTIMQTPADRRRLADEVLRFAVALGEKAAAGEVG